MVTPDYIKQLITASLPCTHIVVEGDDGTHFSAVIVSAEFSGRNRVQQHQLVYKALGDRMRDEIHALSMKTFSPQEWAEQQG
ncbi:BolA family transcriptional regulator [Aquitalea sp. S1-19]|uniref:BolA/IbaG family iron-sulfur metabolism protein n=1 Tax=Craterilacuibacter sinensis TaxID=2686017 RepID=A0A845BPL7_9NEIS|nr:BolA family protein [Craterilacuibacter sinensis]MCP9759541.1 BolA family transcriptional regulator [Aquitalea sp. S1-19]MXR38259.1 BolA/IbaG family iron-sulfur metabolism protein [Craterilacuibacter sinensis]RQW28048.1 BolA family transcriptional regulator [Rhodobacteraceae bacterium CH30]